MVILLESVQFNHDSIITTTKDNNDQIEKKYLVNNATSVNAMAAPNEISRVLQDQGKRQQAAFSAFPENPFQRHDILLEYKNLSHHPYDETLDGLFVMPSQENIFIWFGLLFVKNSIIEER